MWQGMTHRAPPGHGGGLRDALRHAHAVEASGDHFQEGCRQNASVDLRAIGHGAGQLLEEEGYTVSSSHQCLTLVPAQACRLRKLLEQPVRLVGVQPVQCELRVGLHMRVVHLGSRAHGHENG